jgi:hypothetical protein
MKIFGDRKNAAPETAKELSVLVEFFKILDRWEKSDRKEKFNEGTSGSTDLEAGF